MRIAICSAYEMAGVVDAWKPDLRVSALSPGIETVGPATANHLRLSFHDIEQAKRGRLYGARPGDVEALIGAIRTHRPERLLVTCLVGLSRSPALAMIAVIADGHSVEAACDAVHAAVPQASPNRWVLKLGGMALGLGDELKAMAMNTFTYRRCATGPIGQRTKLVELSLLHIVGASK